MAASPAAKVAPRPPLPRAPKLFDAGRNCYRVAQAGRAAFIVDAENYFDAFVHAAAQARHSIIILGWDFHSATRLNCSEQIPGMPETLGAFLNHLVERRRGLHIHVLDWDFPVVFGTDRELSPLLGLGWTPAPRVHFSYDNTHPVGGSHHQKIVVIDDALAFSGGLDLTTKRWDTCDHRAHEPRRCCEDAPYPPFHDVMAMVDGQAAKVLAGIARQRWMLATGEILPPVAAAGDAWPVRVPVDARGITVGISRTLPAQPGAAEVREVEALYLDMIARARHSIYIENQYLTAHKLGAALAARLAERDGPEIVIVLRLLSHGWLEENTMHALRTRLIRSLRAADRWKRFGLYYPHIPGLPDGTCLDIHSKVMVVDDQWLRIGSANLCNRSMGMDSECDLTFEAGNHRRHAGAIVKFRNRLLAEHLGVSPQQVQAAHARAGTLNGTIAALHTEGRSLRPLEHLPEWSEAAVSVAALADPDQPVPIDTLIEDLAMNKEKSGPSWGSLLLIALVVAGLAALWRFTPLGELMTADRVIQWAQDFSDRPWAPLVILLAYTPACFVMFPRPLITLFSIVAFGAWLGFAYAMSGILLAALATYFVGRLLERSTVRRLAGRKLHRLSEMLRRRGLIACIAVRLVPLAPFAVEGLVAGAIRIKLWQFMLGTAIGILPGTLATTVFGDQLQAALRDPAEINYLLVAGVVALLAVAVLVVRKWLAKSSTGPRRRRPVLRHA